MPQATASHQNQSIQVTGIPHHTEAASGSPVFRIAAADIGELRTSRGRRAFGSLDAGGGRHGGIWSRRGAGVCVFMRWVLFRCGLLFWLVFSVYYLYGDSI